jgi:hypothetical protein
MILWIGSAAFAAGAARQRKGETRKAIETDPVKNATANVEGGRQTFRFDTFGDQASWGDTLKLHQAIEAI